MTKPPIHARINLAWDKKVRMARKDSDPANRGKHLEDYDPGATEEEVLAALRKAVRTPKRPSQLPSPASSKTSALRPSGEST